MTCPSCGSSRVKHLWWRIWTAAYRCLDCGREWEVRVRPGAAVALLLALASPLGAQEPETAPEPPPSPGVSMGFLCTVPQGDEDPHAGCEPAVALPIYSRPAGEGRRWSLLAAVTEERAGLGVGYCAEAACIALGVVAPWSTEAGWEVEEWRFAGGVSVGLRNLVEWVGR